MVSVVKNSSQESCVGVFKGQGFGCGGGGESGHSYGSGNLNGAKW